MTTSKPTGPRRLRERTLARFAAGAFEGSDLIALRRDELARRASDSQRPRRGEALRRTQAALLESQQILSHAGRLLERAAHAVRSGQAA